MWTQLPCKTLDAIDFDDSDNRIYAATTHGGHLYFHQRRRISVWDPSDPKDVRHLGDHPVDPSGEGWLRGNEWWFCNGNDFRSPGIEAVNLDTMTSRRVSDTPIKSALPVGNDVWVVWGDHDHRAGLGRLSANGDVEELTEMEEMTSYRADLCHEGNTVFTAARHGGFSAFDVSVTPPTLLKNNKVGYCPTRLFEYKPGFVLGIEGEGLIQYDLRKPAKLKRLKPARFSNYDLAEETVFRAGDEAIVVGERNYVGLVIGTVTLSDGPPVVADKHEEKKVGDPGSGKGLSGFRLVHMVGDVLLIYTMERVLVFRRT